MGMKVRWNQLWTRTGAHRLHHTLQSWSEPTFVAGSPDDVVVDWEAVEETARWFGCTPVKWERIAHDCMLDTRWKAAASSLENWLDTLHAEP